MKEAIILAGGLGTRLRSVVGELPKPMAPIAGKPFLEILLEQLAEKGIARVILSLGYKSEVIRTHFGDKYGDLSITYVVEDTPLGTGGAIRASLAYTSSNPVLILNGDTYLDLELDALRAFWQKNLKPIIVVREVPDVSRFGYLDTSDGRIVEFSEKKATGPGLINAGAYVFHREIASEFPASENFAIERDFLMKAVEHSHFNAFVTQGKFIDIGVPEDYQRAQVELRET